MADIETFKQLVNQQYPQYKDLIDAYLSELGDVDYSDWTTEEMVSDFIAYAEYVIGDAFEECTCKDCDKEEENKITIPEVVDPELLMKVLGNPEMAALLTSLAKTMKV